MRAEPVGRAGAGAGCLRRRAAIDWHAARADGIRFAFAKASLGLELDPEFRAKFRGAKGAGLRVGAYHYLWPGVDTAGSVAMFLKAVRDANGGDLQAVRLALDVEHSGYSQSDGETVRAIKAWVAEYRRQAPDKPLVLYTGKWFWDGRIGDPPGEWIGPLWHSHYVTVDSPTAYRKAWALVPSSWWLPGYGGWKRATFLQFTSKGRIGGSAEKVDVNAFDGTLVELDALGAIDVPIPDTSTAGDPPMQPLPLTSETPKIVKIGLGVPLYNLDGDRITQTARAGDWFSPFGVSPGGVGYRIVPITTHGERVIAMVKASAVEQRAVPDTGITAADLAAAVEAVRTEEQAKAVLAVAAAVEAARVDVADDLEDLAELHAAARVFVKAGGLA
jgi:GH25 family lysozyme M1 (1,4-beta-N-acetylmuramidase)